MPVFVMLIIATAGVCLALLLAYVPMRILLTQMAKWATAPIRELIQRQRDRRHAGRDTPDRRRV
jgi:hypothetical protein